MTEPTQPDFAPDPDAVYWALPRPGADEPLYPIDTTSVAERTDTDVDGRGCWVRSAGSTGAGKWVRRADLHRFGEEWEWWLPGRPSWERLGPVAPVHEAPGAACAAPSAAADPDLLRLARQLASGGNDAPSAARELSGLLGFPPGLAHSPPRFCVVSEFHEAGVHDALVLALGHPRITYDAVDAYLSLAEALKSRAWGGRPVQIDGVWYFLRTDGSRGQRCEWISTDANSMSAFDRSGIRDALFIAVLHGYKQLLAECPFEDRPQEVKRCLTYSDHLSRTLNTTKDVKTRRNLIDDLLEEEELMCGWNEGDEWLGARLPLVLLDLALCHESQSVRLELRSVLLDHRIYHIMGKCAEGQPDGVDNLLYRLRCDKESWAAPASEEEIAAYLGSMESAAWVPKVMYDGTIRPCQSAWCRLPPDACRELDDALLNHLSSVPMDAEWAPPLAVPERLWRDPRVVDAWRRWSEAPWSPSHDNPTSCGYVKCLWAFVKKCPSVVVSDAALRRHIDELRWWSTNAARNSTNLALAPQAMQELQKRLAVVR